MRRVTAARERYITAAVFCGLLAFTGMSTPLSNDVVAFLDGSESRVGGLTGTDALEARVLASEILAPEVHQLSPGAPEVIWPASGEVTSEFGSYEPFRLAWGIGRHSGIDIANVVGTPVLAYRSGTVSSVEYSGACGRNVVLMHDDSESRYCHLSGTDVVTGQLVNTGDKIGRMGSSGVSTGSHLHFQITKAGQLVDPRSVVPGEP